MLRNNWTPWIENSDLFKSAEDAQPFVVLTMCRSLCTLETGAVASKTRSAEWTMANTGGHWSELIRQALAWRHGDPPGDVVQTQAFMRYVLRRAGL